MSETGVVVCGFADEAAEVAGLAWDLAGERGGLIARGGEIAVGEAEISEAGDGVRIELSAGDLTCEAELTPRSPAAALGSPGGNTAPGDPRSAICDAKVVLSEAGEKRTIECAGHLTRWDSSPTEDAELVRHLVIPAPDDAILILAARRTPGGGGHDTEQTAAWLLAADGHATAFGEALLSTQYDDSGRQTRAGLELWPAESDAPPLRAAGTVLVGQSANGERVTAALLHSSAEGAAGLGSYVIWRS